MRVDDLGVPVDDEPDGFGPPAPCRGVGPSDRRGQRRAETGLERLERRPVQGDVLDVVTPGREHPAVHVRLVAKGDRQLRRRYNGLHPGELVAGRGRVAAEQVEADDQRRARPRKAPDSSQERGSGHLAGGRRQRPRRPQAIRPFTANVNPRADRGTRGRAQPVRRSRPGRTIGPGGQSRPRPPRRIPAMPARPRCRPAQQPTRELGERRRRAPGAPRGGRPTGDARNAPSAHRRSCGQRVSASGGSHRSAPTSAAPYYGAAPRGNVGMRVTASGPGLDWALCWR